LQNSDLLHQKDDKSHNNSAKELNYYLQKLLYSIKSINNNFGLVSALENTTIFTIEDLS